MPGCFADITGITARTCKLVNNTRAKPARDGVFHAKQFAYLKGGKNQFRTPESDVFKCFELINHTMAKKLKDNKQAGKLVADLSRLAHTYVSSYCPTTADLKKLEVLKEIRKNKNIVILKPDRTGMVWSSWTDLITTKASLKLSMTPLNSGQSRKIQPYLERVDVSSEN